MSDVIVVGAGVGGLAGAICCAAQGHKVLVLESGAEPGGKLGRVTVAGVELDTGPSVLTLPGVFDELLALAGEPPLETVRPLHWFRYRFADGLVIEVGHGLRATLEGVRAALGAGPAGQLERFLEKMRAAWEVAAPRFVFGDAPTLRTLATARPDQLRKIHPFTTLWELICAEVEEPHLRMVLARFATYAGSDARRAPAVLGTIAWVELGLGGYGVGGGMYRLSERLVQAARKLGVELRSGARVAQIRVERGRATGVQLESGAFLPSDAVLCNSEARAALGSLLPKPLRRTLSGEPSFSGRCLVLRTERAERPAHEVIFPSRYLGELEDLSAGREPRDPAIYLCAPEQAHLAPGWDQDEPLFAMTNAPAGAADDPGWAERVRVTLLERRVIAPSARLVWQRGPGALAARFPESGGALYGLASHSWRTAFQRPANRVPHLRGLYLAGGSAHPGAGLPLVAASGKRAALALCQDLGKGHLGKRLTAAVGLALLLLALPARASPSRSGNLALAMRMVARTEVEPAAARTALNLLRDDPEPEARVVEAEAAFHLAVERDQHSFFVEALRRSRLAVEVAPRSGAARLWLALSLAREASSRGLLALLFAAQEVRSALLESAALEADSPTGVSALTLSALCGLYHRAPGSPFSFGDDELSSGYCQRALEKDPRSWEAHQVLAERALTRGDLVVLREHLDAIFSGPLDPRAPLTHARYRREASLLREALP